MLAASISETTFKIYHLIQLKAMKKILIIFIASLITKNSIAQAKVFNYGIKAGISAGKIAILPPLQNRTEHYGIGFVAGGMVQMQILKDVKIQIESLYNLHKSSLKFNPAINAKAIDLSLHNVSIPLLLSYSVIPNLSINAGALCNYNFYFFQNVSMDSGGNPGFNITGEISKFQPGLLGGITFNVNNIFVDGRYNRMLGNLYKQKSSDDKTEYHPGNFQLSLGYRF